MLGVVIASATVHLSMDGIAGSRSSTVIILKIRQNFNNYCCRCRFFRVKHDVNGHNFDRFSNT